MDAALTKLQSTAGAEAKEAMTLLARILGNIMDQPAEPKFRRLNPESAKLKTALLRHAGAVEFLLATGFTKSADGSFELQAGREAGLATARAKVLRLAQDGGAGRAPAPGPAPTAPAADSPDSIAYRKILEGGAHGAGLAEVEAAASQEGGKEALQLLDRVLTNVRRYPDNDKYLSVNLAGAAGKKLLPLAALLKVAGFEQKKLPSGEDCLKLTRVNTDVLERVTAMIYWASRSDPPPALPSGSPILSRALGAVLGAAIGDALGAPLGGRGPLEMNAEEVDKAMEMCGGGSWMVAPGQATSNTELQACLAEALSEVKAPVKDFPLDDAALRYGRWGRSLPFRGERACKQAFGGRLLAGAEMVEHVKDVNQKVEGGGALTRCAPLAAAAAAAGSPTAAAAWARSDAQLSHPGAQLGTANAVFAVALAFLIAGKDRKTAMADLQDWLEVEKARAAPSSKAAKQDEPWEPPGERLVALEVAVGWMNKAFGEADLPFSDMSPVALREGEVGTVEIPFTHAFRQLRAGAGFEQAMRAVLAGGGDSTTTGAAVGALFGALVGVEGLPQRWVRAVLTTDVSMGQARPPEYQPSCLPGLMQKICAC